MSKTYHLKSGNIIIYIERQIDEKLSIEARYKTKPTVEDTVEFEEYIKDQIYPDTIASKNYFNASVETRLKDIQHFLKTGEVPK